MADPALGVLRRPTRPLEHRLERIARWRAQGLANGAADSTFPSDTTDAAVFASGGDTSVITGAGAAPKWEYDEFSLTSSTTNSFALTATPVDKSEVVRVNGLVLTRAEYTITGSTLTFTDLDAVRLGIGSDTWTIALNYAYFDLATPSGTEFAGAFVLAIGDAFPRPVTPDDVAVLFVRDDGLTPSGVFSTWTRLRDAGSTGMDVWIGSGVGSGTAVTMPISFADTGVIAVFTGASTLPSISVLQSTVATPPTGSTISAPAAAAAVGQMVVSAAVMTGSGSSWALDSTVTPTGFDAPLSVFTGNSFYNIGLVAGLAAATTVDAVFGLTGSGGSGGGEAINVVFGPAPSSDPVIAVPGGTYTPPTPPSTPGTHILRYHIPDVTGWETLDVSAGGTFVLDHTKDWYVTASSAVTSNYVRLVGGRNIVVYGVVFDFSGTIPSGSYDADRRGLHFKDGPNPNLKRVIYVEGVWFRSGYYSDGIQLALRYENDVTFICQALRSDAYGWGQRSGVHSDLIQFYGGPLNALLDCITGKHQTYQGIFGRPADGRALPSGPDKIDWQYSRINLESSIGPDGTGAHYLMWDDQPAWTNLTLDEVYITGGRNDVTDSNGNIPSAGLHQNATPSGGDWAPASWWPSGVYTSPGYV